MKRAGTYLLFAMLLCVATAKAQLPVGQLFLSMPDSLCPYLDMRQKMLLLEYGNHGATDSVENIYGGYSRVLHVTERSLSIQIADGFVLELLQDSSSFYLIQTACAPICSSIAKQYVANWMFLSEIEPPIGGLFCKATIENDSIVWTDETPLLLDDEELKHYR